MRRRTPDASSERAAEDHSVDGCAIVSAVIAPPAGDFGETGAEIKSQRRFVIGGNLEKSGGCAARRGLVGKCAEGAASVSLAPLIGMGGEGQNLGLINNDAAKHEAGGVTHQKDRRIGKEAAKFISAPAARVAKGKSMGGSQSLSQIGHGRITGGASREGAASAART